MRLWHPQGRHDPGSFDTNHAQQQVMQQSDTRELGIGQDPHRSSSQGANYRASRSNAEEAR